MRRARHARPPSQEVRSVASAGAEATLASSAGGREAGSDFEFAAAAVVDPDAVAVHAPVLTFIAFGAAEGTHEADIFCAVDRTHIRAAVIRFAAHDPVRGGD